MVQAVSPSTHVLHRGVAFYADLTPYTYWETNPQSYSPSREEPWPCLPVVNVGWLNVDHAFPTGALPDGVSARLEQLARVRVLQTSGYHYCEFCIRDLGGDAEIRHLDAASRMDLINMVARESAEFRVKGNGVVYAVPQLVLHYIAAHRYLPPAEFCDAVVASTR